MLVTGVPVAAAAPGGSISGAVVSAVDGTPLADVCVNVEGTKLSALTDGKGAYTIGGLDAGAYTLAYSDCAKTPSYADQWYLGHADSGKADTVTVVDGENTALKTVQLEAIEPGDSETPAKPDAPAAEAEPGMQVSGIVTDSGGTTPLEGISVNLYSNTGGPGTSTVTAPDGTYLTDELPAGDYRVEFTGGSFAREYWKDQYTWNTANLLTLGTGPGVVSDINASLTEGATITGTVTDPGGLPVGGVCVSAFLGVNGGEWVNGANTAPDGTYSIGGLPATDLRVRFDPCGTPYVEQWYAGARWFDESTPIVLGEGEVRPGVDAQLAAGITISGHVTDSSNAPISGIYVNVNPDGPGSGGWGQTDIDGNYTTTSVAPGNYRVQFNDSGPTWASQYWNGKQSWNQATILTISETDAPNRAGIDAVLTQAVTITGTVTRPDGDPAANACVNAVVDGPDGFEGVGFANVQSDGTYAMTGLTAGPMRVLFQDCNNVGPWVTQWWDNQPTPEAATVINPAPGDTITDIDAHFAPAAQIRGHVTDLSDTPLDGICAQATSPDWVGGLGRTDSSGDYTITVGRPGTYKVQFVDCNETPKFAGEWWDDAATAADATPVSLGTGEVVNGVGASLATGAAATVSGNVHDLTGAPLTAACIVVYLPNQFALFAPVQPDGSYVVPNVPSGTYAIAALGCGEGEEPSPVVPSGVPSVAYRAMWWNGVPLDLVQGTDGGPDPIAQGAVLVTITPGAELTGYDFCFGCTAIDVTTVTPTTDSVSIDFDTPGLIDLAGESEASVSSADVSAAAVAPLVYVAACTSPDGGTTSATSSDIGAIVLTGLSPGTSYTCQVTASDGVILVAASTAFAAVTLGVPGGGVPGDPAGTTPAALAFTGSSSSGPLALLAVVLLALGLVILTVSRRIRTND